MNTYLLDTNVISYFMKQHSLAAQYQSLVQGASLAASFMTVGELFEGAIRANWGPAKVNVLESRIKSYVVFHSSEATCRLWAEVRMLRRRQPIAVDDAWIAATALKHDIPLVTHNRSDFDGIPNLNVISLNP